jgi:hypothetical protein
MPKSQYKQSSFASGELSPLLIGRTDLDQYYKGGQSAENVVIVPQGGVKRRPGTEFIDGVVRALVRQTAVTPTMPNGGVAANINDGDDETFGITNVLTSAGNPNVVAQYDFGSQTLNDFIDLRNVSLIPSPAVADGVVVAAFMNIQYSDNAIDWTSVKPGPFGIFMRVDNVSPRNIRFKIDNLNKRYWRVLAAVPIGNSVQIKVGEFGFKNESLGIGTAKTFDWHYGVDQSYLGVLTAGNLRFYRTPHAGSTETVYVADVIVPYSEAAIDSVRDAQTENVMLMFQEDYPPVRIVFSGLDETDAFVLDNIPFINVPQYDYDDVDSPISIPAIQVCTFSGFTYGQQYQIDVDGVLSKDITYSGDSNADEQSSTAFHLQKNLQDMPNFGFSGISVARTHTKTYTITMAGASAGEYELFAGFPTSGNVNDTIAFTITQNGQSQSEDVWSEARGYPKLGVFFEGRLWLGGTKSKPQSLFASRSGSYFDFFSEKGEDDEGIFITIDSRGLTNIVDINPDRGLQVFCSGSEFVVQGKTPSDIAVVAQTQHGSINLESKAVDGATLFVDKNGNTLRQYVFSFNEDAYTSNDISVLSSQLINQPVDMALLSGSTTEDANWVFLVNQDGTGAVLNTMRAQDINGFTRWTPSPINTIKSCSAVGDEMYMIVYRQVGIADYYDIERWSFDYLTESALKTTVVNMGSDVIIPVGSRLEGYEVSVVADGDVLPSRVVAFDNGAWGITITAAELNGFSTRDIEVGLNFPVTVKTMPVNTSSGTRLGQNSMREKKICRMNLRVYETAGVYVDGNPVAIRQFGAAPNTPLNTSFTPITGVIEDDNGGNGWGIDVVPEITVPDPTPFHLQAIEYEVESS